MTFYVSPSPFAEYEHIRINMSLPNGCEQDPENQPALIFWDSGNYFSKSFLIFFGQEKETLHNHIINLSIQYNCFGGIFFIYAYLEINYVYVI
jgi:hypothetical protein